MNNIIKHEHDHKHKHEHKTSIQITKDTLEKINAVKLVLKKRSLSNEKLILLALDTLIEKFDDNQKSIYQYITYDDEEDKS